MLSWQYIHLFLWLSSFISWCRSHNLITISFWRKLNGVGIHMEPKPSKWKNTGNWEEAIWQIGGQQEVYMRLILAETNGNKIWTLKWPHPAAKQDPQWGVKDTHWTNNVSTQNLSCLQEMQVKIWNREWGNGKTILWESWDSSHGWVLYQSSKLSHTDITTRHSDEITRSTDSFNWI